MKRAIIQFDEQTYQKLRQQAFREQRSISAVVREMVGTSLGTKVGRKKRVSQFASVRAGRSKQGPLSPVSEKHDQALAALRK